MDRILSREATNSIHEMTRFEVHFFRLFETSLKDCESFHIDVHDRSILEVTAITEREDLEGILPVQGPIEEIYLEEVITQMGKMKKNKACGPDCLPIEVAKALGDEGAIWMTGVLNEVMRKGIPEEWRTSTITPIYKQKGDPLECNNFRGIKLLSHTLKLWERVVESRLRKMVNISER